MARFGVFAVMAVIVACDGGALPTDESVGLESQPARVAREVVHEFGMVGLAPGQSLRIHAVNIGNPNESPTGVPVDLELLDSDGGVIAPCISEALRPGASALLNYDLAANNPPEPDVPALRRAVRARVRIAARAARLIASSLEVFDSATGRGAVTALPYRLERGRGRGAVVSDFALFGVVPGELVRLNAVFIGNPNDKGIGNPDVREVALRIVSSDGAVLAARDGAALTLGGSTFLDFDPNAAPTRDPGVNPPDPDAPTPGGVRRMRLRAQVIALGGPDTKGYSDPDERPGVLATLEIVDRASGRTSTLLLPAAVTVASTP